MSIEGAAMLSKTNRGNLIESKRSECLSKVPLKTSDTSEFVANYFRENFFGLNLLLASNREPYVHQRLKGVLKTKEPVGGLTRALDPVMRAIGGTWVAWGSGNADREKSDEEGREPVPPLNPKYTLRRIWLEPNDLRAYYYGFSNQVLWPLFHNMLEKVRFRRWFWKHYVHVNRKFATILIEELAKAPSLLWIHDYHLALCPAMVRKVLPQTIITQFWHIPWVASEVLRALPQASDLLSSLLANDLLVFHTTQFVQNFLTACAKMLPHKVDFAQGKVDLGNRECYVSAVPISVDFAEINDYAASERSMRMINRFRDRYKLENYKVGLSVDRIDYTKGLLEKIDAVELFYEKYPAWRTKFSVIMVSASSRESIKAYRELKEKLLQRIKEVNERFGTADWTPIIFTGPMDKWSLIPLFRLSDLALISSLKDGMNLVAKEFIASQVDEKGVLLLSEFAGAADEMDYSIPINPYYTEDHADKIHFALSMPTEEIRQRMKALRRSLSNHNVYKWMREILCLVKEQKAD